MKSAITLHSSATLSSAVPADSTATVPAARQPLVSQAACALTLLHTATYVLDASEVTDKQHHTFGTIKERTQASET